MTNTTLNATETNTVEAVEVSKINLKKTALISTGVAAVAVAAFYGYKFFKRAKVVVEVVDTTTETAEAPATAE